MIFLKFKNLLLKCALTILGFTMAASQCLAQYEVILPKVKIWGQLKGITDTISKFRLVVNTYDTIYTSWEQKYSFLLTGRYMQESIEIQVTEVFNANTGAESQYLPKTVLVAMKPKDFEDCRKEVDINLEKK
jgi:hypothetical protein